MFKKVGNSKGFQVGKGFFDKAWTAADKYIGEPMNKYSGKLGIEGVWPTTMDKECDKAARILRVFTLDGGIETEEKLNVLDADAKKKSQRVVKRIPAKALREAKGIAIFTVWRTGLGFSAASGSGIVIARKPDGSWSGPSGLLVHTIGFGFMFGMDVYDVVLILRTDAAVKSFMRPKVNIGGEISVAAGPLGGSVMADAGYQQAPAWSYVKSKGFYAGVQLDGSIIVERQDENAKFYSGKYTVEDILGGRVHTPIDAEGLIQTIQAASDRDTKTDQIPSGLAPSEATGGRLDPKDPRMQQPKDGFGAPPSYGDLEEIKVKCSDCGESMSMEELSIHDCSITQVKASTPAEKKRQVPLPPPRALPVQSETESTHEEVPKDIGISDANKGETTASEGEHKIEGGSEKPEETIDLSTAMLANTIDDANLETRFEKASDAAMVADMQEIKLRDDDDDVANEGKIEMTILDEDLKKGKSGLELSKTPSESSFKSAREV